jgi:molecular chaperone DnaK
MLDGILPAPRGIPQIEVTFDIDANGILSVSAQDKGTGKEQRIVIQSGSGMDKADINRMVDEARQFEADDQRRRTEVETRNQADSLAYQAEKLLNDNADKVPEELKAEVQGKIDALRAAVAANNVAEMQSGAAELNAALQRLGEVVYSQQNAGGGPAGGATGPDGPAGGAPGDAGTVEGEFREV